MSFSKHQASSTKLQRNSKFQAPGQNHVPPAARWFLQFGSSLVLGAWCLVLVSASSVCAHPGHGLGEVQSAHLVTQADHLGALLATGVVVFCLCCALRWFNRNPKAT
jgi:hypothetical protein